MIVRKDSGTYACRPPPPWPPWPQSVAWVGGRWRGRLSISANDAIPSQLSIYLCWLCLSRALCSSLLLMIMMMSRTILCGKGKSLARQVWIWFSGKERTWLRSTIEARQSKFKVSLEGINIYYLIFISFESINEIDESWEFEALCQFLDINEIRKMGRVPFKHQIQPVCDLPKKRDFVINWIVSIER